MSIASEYSNAAAIARTANKAGFNLALATAILFDANARLDKPANNTVFVHPNTKAYVKAAFYKWRAPEDALRGFMSDLVGADYAKGTMSRGFSNGRTLYMRRREAINELLSPWGRNSAWTAAEKMDVLREYLAADGIRTEADIMAANAGKATREKTEAEKGATALATFLKHAKDNPALRTMAISALETFGVNPARHAEIMRAMSGTASQMEEEADETMDPPAPGVPATDDIPISSPAVNAALAV